MHPFDRKHVQHIRRILVDYSSSLSICSALATKDLTPAGSCLRCGDGFQAALNLCTWLQIDLVRTE